jgi:hypothetical protein
MSVATAGQVRVEIDVAYGNSGPEDWKECRGVQKWDPAWEQKTEDDTDVSSDGAASEYPVGTAFTIGVDGLTKGDEVDNTFVIDPGVQALLVASRTYRKKGIVHMRYWRTDGIPEAFEFYATAGVKSTGEKPPALQKWSGTLKGRGNPTPITIPLTPLVFNVSVGAATAGTFPLIYDGDEITAQIAFGATNAQVKSALVALDDGFKASDWTVTGASPNWVVTTPGGVLEAGTPVGLTGGTLTVTPA